MAITFFHLRTWVVATIVTIAGFASGVELLAKAQTQSSCSVENKSQYYREFVSADEGDAKDLDKALRAAKRYLACPVDARRTTGDFGETQCWRRSNIKLESFAC